ncbi:MAG: HNH endonuclease signature motif containing protein, partial [Terriglobales bacterium]
MLVEAGHRCAIPTCRATTTEIAHIAPWAETHDHSFENLIALCPNCHTRYDQKKEIDRKSMHLYKQNLAVLNGRYSDFERRVFQHFAETSEALILVAAGTELMLANAVRDGLIVRIPVEFGTYNLSDSNGFKKSFPMNHTFQITPKGLDFVRKFKFG